MLHAIYAIERPRWQYRSGAFLYDVRWMLMGQVPSHVCYVGYADDLC